MGNFKTLSERNPAAVIFEVLSAVEIHDAFFTVMKACCSWFVDARNSTENIVTNFGDKEEGSMFFQNYGTDGPVTRPCHNPEDSTLRLCQ